MSLYKNSICTMSSKPSKPRVFRYGHGMKHVVKVGDFANHQSVSFSHINVTHISNTYTHIYMNIYIYSYILPICHREYHLTPVHIEHVIQDGDPQ